LKRRSSPALKKYSAAILLIFFLIPFCAIAFPAPVKAYGRSVVACWNLANPVVIDGKWTTVDEWKDAEEIPMYDMAETQYYYYSTISFFRVKHDTNYIYILIEFISNKKAEVSEFATICIDTTHNGGTAPQTDDYRFTVKWESETVRSFKVERGNGAAWSSLSTPIGEGNSNTDISSSPYSNDHVMYEFKIPITIFQGYSVFPERVGFSIFTYSPQMYWPAKLPSGDKPDSWGDLMIRPEPNYYGYLACWSLSSPVTVDGKWTTEAEWSDVEEMPMYSQPYCNDYYYSHTAFFRIKNDTSYIYILIDFISDVKVEPGSFAAVCIDTLHDGGAAPQADDYKFTIEWISETGRAYKAWRGNGAAWVSITPIGEGDSSTDVSNNPHAWPHTIYEFKIPRSIFGSSPPNVSGICVYAEGSLTVHWPNWAHALNLDEPSSWGDFNYVIPEFPRVALAIPAVILVAFATLYQYSLERKRRLKRA
jgi:hypothetical protein